MSEAGQLQTLVTNLLAQPVSLAPLAKLTSLAPLVKLIRAKRNSHDNDFHYHGNGLTIHIKYDDVTNKLGGGVMNITIDDLQTILPLSILIHTRPRKVKLFVNYQISKGKMFKFDIHAGLEVFDGTFSRYFIRDFTISSVKKGMWHSEVALKPEAGHHGNPFKFTMESCSKCFNGKVESDAIPLINTEFKGTYTLGNKFEISLTHASGIDLAFDFALGKNGNVFSMSLFSDAMPQYINFNLEVKKNSDGNKSELKVMLSHMRHEPTQELFSISFELNDPNDKSSGGKLRITSGNIENSMLLSNFVRLYGRPRREIRKCSLELAYSKVGPENYSFHVMSTEIEKNGLWFYKPNNPAFYDTDEYFERNLVFSITSKKKDRWDTLVSVKLSDRKPSTEEVNEVESVRLTMDHCSKCIKGKLVSYMYEDFVLTFEGKHVPGDSLEGSAKLLGEEVLTVNLKGGYMEGLIRGQYKGEGLELLLDTEGSKETQELRTFKAMGLQRGGYRQNLGQLIVTTAKIDENTKQVDISSRELGLAFTVVTGDKTAKLIVDDFEVESPWKDTGLMINDVQLKFPGGSSTLKWDFVNKESLGYAFTVEGKKQNVSFKYTEESRLSITPTMYAENISYKFETVPRDSQDFTAEVLVEVGRGSSDHFKLTGTLDLNGDDKAASFALENGQLQYSYD